MYRAARAIHDRRIPGVSTRYDEDLALVDSVDKSEG